MRRLSERVSYQDEFILFDGDPLTNALARLIISGDRSYPRFVHVMEHLATNPSSRARKQLFTWLADRDMTITPDGPFIGYKGVNIDPDNSSIHAGRATVNAVSNTTGTSPTRSARSSKCPAPTSATTAASVAPPGCTSGLMSTQLFSRRVC